MSGIITPDQKAMLEKLFRKEMEKQSEQDKKTQDFFKSILHVKPYEGEK